MNELEQMAGDSGTVPSQAGKDLHSGGTMLPDLRSWVRDLGVSLILAGIVIVFLYQPVKVEGTSMMPRLVDQERIFINKFVYQLGPIHRGDVVVFRYPFDPSKSYIKRVVGLPGETVRLVSGTVFINGRKLEEGYVGEEFRDRQSHAPLVIPSDQYYVLGDRRNSSNDSRVWGPVPQQYIYGKAVFAYWPVDRLGFLP